MSSVLEMLLEETRSEVELQGSGTQAILRYRLSTQYILDGG